ncbi:hypothetical protein DXG03_003279 [Asterophora parasitica]|uniref:K+ potassium transporter integral membrane domain-containing protein n=1 Tax=Asterophora parasitica TaxID=117018 RepID=A0A9P7GGD5_9AGAR|nr:hypothetical protein DXG03_003279 [Asterophora parasitica]
MSSPTAPLTSPENLEKGHASVNVNQKRETLKLRGWPLLLLSFQALAGAPSKEDVIGGISAIVWALTLLPLLKYVFISLEFGTGEGT